MRFKRVEISAFRIYDKPEQATFDFTTSTGETASFISLYAPNGFGKTSFYDAVEWGVTNNIQRFSHNESITGQSLETLSEITDEKIKLLRNTESDEQTKSYVKILTDGKPIAKRELKTHGNSKNDLTHGSKLVNKSFRRVILSQEWISAFLKEVDGVQRYKLFMENPDLAELDLYYRNVKGLVNANQNNIEALDEKLNKEKDKIREEEDSKLLDTINTCILLLQDLGEERMLVTLSTTAKEALELSNDVAVRLLHLNQDREAADNVIRKINEALTGSDQVSGLDVFFKDLEAAEANGKLLHDTVTAIADFGELQRKSNELDHSLELKNAGRKALKSALEIRELFPVYEQNEKLLVEKRGQLAGQQRILDEQQPVLQKLLDEESMLHSRINNNLSAITEGETAYKDLPAARLIFEDMQTRLADREAVLKVQEQDKNDKEKQQKRVRENIVYHRRLLIDIEKFDYLTIRGDTTFSDLHPQIGQMIENRKKWAELENILLAIGSQAEQQVSFSQEIEVFIKKGMDIINREQMNTCPLCSHDYRDYTALAAQLSKNKLLSALLQENYQRQKETRGQILKLERAVTKTQKTVITAVNKRIRALEEQLNNLAVEVKGLERHLAVNWQDAEAIRLEMQQMTLQMDGMNFSEFESYINETLNAQRILRESLFAGMEKLKAEIGPLHERLSSALAKLESLEKEIYELVNEASSLSVHLWFMQNSTEVPVEKRSLDEQIQLLEDKNRDHQLMVDSLSTELTALRESLASYQQDELLLREKVLRQDEERLLKSISGYRYFLQAELSVQVPEQVTKEIILTALNKINASIRLTIDRTTALVGEYGKLERFASNLMPFLQSENARLNYELMLEEREFLIRNVMPFLQSEKDRVKSHLEKEIKSFFFTGLINQLYNKIDPHPEFTTVEFHANFDSDNPSLDVIVTNTSNEKKVIPHLYFSSAQVNILSLSIFLASALNSKEYDCIFIDDPVQSMDSINVLSTIDLLRSIVVNHGKQIILSTHDENFHNLLKKKIPSRLFSSKFLELESFGKVKAQA